ncbi:MAG: alanine--glyoxylate aminotransferase family protein [Chloroflexi bacterium]|nr:alanine--glyoxylate aminotransferase family protein [Chloroflexota bacterium]
MTERDLLMIPGPTMVDPAVLRATAAPVRSQVSPEFIEIFGSALENLRVVFGARSGVPFVFAGSGTLSLEFGAANLIEPGDKVLVVDTGVFAYRFKQVCERYDAALTVLSAPLGETVPLERIERELSSGAYKLIEVCHVDTSTDVMVDIAAVGRLVRQYGALYVVDGVCAAGGVEVNCDAWDVDIYLSASQKAISVPPGLVICWVSERALEAIRARRKPVANFYCDALNWLAVMQSYEARKPAYFATPPINLICGLHESLLQILSETIGQRLRRHQLLSRAFKAGVEALGLQQVAMPNDILATLGAIESALLACEYDMQPGAGLRAAMQVLVEM